MTKKKRNHPDVEEVLARPWCYYCERDFDDLKILISHQKAKHFKCERCGRRLNTAGGLSVHMNQVHKETLSAVENALPNRSEVSIEIFGMMGIPEDVVQQHQQRVAAQFQQAEADRRAATGNPAPGAAGGSGPKKPKVEAVSDLKKRLADFKAKKAAGETPGSNSGNATPTGAGTDSQQSPRSPAPGLQSGSPQNQQLPQQFPVPGSSPQPPFQAGFNQPPGYAIPQTSYNQNQAGIMPSPQGYPPGMPQYMQYPPAAGFQQPHQFQQGQRQSSSPAQNGSLATPPSLPPPPGLPTPPGLPQRPAFGNPALNSYQMPPTAPGQAPLPNFIPQDPRLRQQEHQSTAQVPSITASSVDDLIASVAKETRANESTKETQNSSTSASAEKKPKKEKDKDKATKLIYSDNEVSPEEKMAKLSRYAFDPSQRQEETVMGDAVHATVTGAVQD